MLRFDRYSPYFDDAAAHGLDLRPSELYSYVYPGTEEELREQVYFFEDRTLGDRGRGVVQTKKHADRPGLDAIGAQVRDWFNIWSIEAPTLEMADDGGVLTVRDTRPVATRSEHRVAGLERAVLLEAHDAPPRHRLVEALCGDGTSETDVEDALARLVADHLVLEIDGRLLALPMLTPVTPVASVFDFPGGFVYKPAPRAAAVKTEAA
ncbi:MAG: hypothetical protein JJ899_17190 [Alphaproteobacteria bacterium]|nr:hypothetical protein [Alphaproteobacteria bacterium]